MYKFGKKQHPAASRVAEQTRAWAGGTVVLGSNSVWSTSFFFFFPHFRKISKFFGGLSCRYSKRKISGTGAGTVDTAYIISYERGRAQSLMCILFMPAHSLVPRPRRRRKEGLVPIARACANYIKKTWGTANYFTLFRPPPAA